MTGRTIFLVYGYDYYEYPYAPIRAYATEADARAFVVEIDAYQETRPKLSFDPLDGEFDSWNAKFAQWREAHPAGDAYDRDGFDMMPLQLVENKPTKDDR